MSTAKVINVQHPSASTPNIVNDASGNVGIGTSSPGTQLNVYKSTATQVAVRPQNSLAYADFGPISDGTVYGPYAAPAASTGLVVGTSNSNPVQLWTNGSERMRIDSSGNVGIGCTPGYLLDVQSTSTSAAYYAQRLYSAANASGVSATYLRLEKGFGYGGAIGGYLSQGVGGGLVLATANGGTFTDQMWIDSNGNVGIGTSSPNASAILDAQSTTKGVRFPNMTTTQKNAVSSPAAGLVVFDTTLAKLCVYSGSAWQTITSV